MEGEYRYIEPSGLNSISASKPDAEGLSTDLSELQFPYLQSESVE